MRSPSTGSRTRAGVHASFDAERPAVFLPDLCGFNALFVVVVVAELVALIIVVAGRGFGEGFASEIGLLSLYTQWLGLSAAAALCLARRPLNGLNERTIAIVSYLIVVGMTYIVAELAWWVVNPVVGTGALVGISRADLIGRTVAISAVVAALVLRYFYVQFHYKQRIASEASARLEALQARIRPHFFFNCMNTIAALTRSNPGAAERAVEDLADLFRASLAEVRTLVPLAEEIGLTERYLNIERLRLGDRLAVEWHVAEDLDGVQLPQLCLQPIVENAIYHGIEPARSGGTIEIVVGGTRERLTIDIDNPLPEAGANAHRHGNRIALANVRDRLRAHFGSNATLEARRDDGRYRVHLEIPTGSGLAR